jgi:uncharacterized membrane protein YhaH (DUF805 family)
MRSPRDKFLLSSLCCFVIIALIIGISTTLGIKSAVSNYNGLCDGFHGEKFTCTLEESVSNSLFGWYLVTSFLTPIPFFFWGIAVGHVVISSMKLGRAIAFFLTFSLAIVAGILGYFVGALFPIVIGEVVKIVGI